jgi:peptidoglycan/xylan/chitin deacetylase (PgdA/CDA1 family)
VLIPQLAFDDGPSGGSDTLYTFLETNNISSKATHFMIGGNILSK